MEILFRLPNLRTGICIRVAHWLFQGINQLRDYYSIETIQDSKCSVPVESTFQKQQFMVKKGTGLTGSIDLFNFVMQCLRCFKYLSADGNKKVGTMHGIEMLKVPEEVFTLKSLIDIINH